MLPDTALTALRLLFTSPRALTNLRDRAFAATWQSLGPMSAEKDLPFVPPVVSQAYGVVVDIGPGGGFNVKHFDKDKCSKIYGVEPNEGLHEQLREEVKKAGLEGIYEVVGKYSKRYSFCHVAEPDILQVLALKKPIS